MTRRKVLFHKPLKQVSSSHSTEWSSFFVFLNIVEYCLIHFIKYVLFMNAGLDLDCGNYYTNFANNAVVQGKIKEGDIDSALQNLYVVLMRLGFFDGSPQYETLTKDDICTDEHIELATEAAREGIVLLKNDDNILPLSADNVKTIAVIGPHANATDTMIGNYAGIEGIYLSKCAYSDQKSLSFH